MSPTSLQGLPSEILARICECLDGDHRPSLAAFAQASKRTHDIAAGLIFRIVVFKVYNADDLARDVEDCLGHLRRKGVLGQVRCLVITGQAPRSSDGVTTPRLYATERRWYIPKLYLSLTEDDHDEITGVLDDSKPVIRGHHYQGDDLASSRQINDNWRPLARLMEELPGLTMLAFRCGGYDSQFPPCLLETLHQRLPRCRLRIDNFRLRSLNRPEIDEYELKLITSPNLHSISVQYEEIKGYDFDGQPNYQGDAVLRMAAGLARNLQDVRILRWAGNEQDFPLPPRPQWNGFVTPLREPLPFFKASLRRLDLGSTPSVPRKMLEDWAQHSNLHTLEDLTIYGAVEQDVLEFISNQDQLTRLQTLKLDLPGGDRWRNTTGQTREYYEAAERFLKRLPELSYLKLTGWVHRMSLSESLGSNLTTLLLEPVLDDGLAYQEVEAIARLCPLLERLGLTLLRSRGDAHEVAAYRSLGSLTRLRRLLLNLQVSPPPSALVQEAVHAEALPNFDELDRQPLECYPPYLKGHARDFFMSAAVDEDLVRSIFDVISSAKAEGSLPLERMKVRVIVQEFGYTHLQYREHPWITSCFEGAWLLRRDPRDDRRDVVRVTETSKRRLKDNYTAPPDLEQVVRRLWPSKGEDEDWRRDLHSWPLET